MFLKMQALLAAAELGLEVFVLDFGWAIQVGEWVVDPVKFPNGLAPLVDKAHALGLRYQSLTRLLNADQLMQIRSSPPNCTISHASTDCTRES